MKYTHTYKNKKGRDVLCYITESNSMIEKMAKISQDFNVIAINENGVHVYILYKNLTKI